MDSQPTQRAYSTSLGNIPYPILADFHPKGAVAQAYGVYNVDRGQSRRAVIIIDKDGVLRYTRVYDQGIPEVPEILQEIDKLNSS